MRLEVGMSYQIKGSHGTDPVIFASASIVGRSGKPLLQFVKPELGSQVVGNEAPNVLAGELRAAGVPVHSAVADDQLVFSNPAMRYSAARCLPESLIRNIEDELADRIGIALNNALHSLSLKPYPSFTALAGHDVPKEFLRQEIFYIAVETPEGQRQWLQRDAFIETYFKGAYRAVVATAQLITPRILDFDEHRNHSLAIEALEKAYLARVG